MLVFLVVCVLLASVTAFSPMGSSRLMRVRGAASMKIEAPPAADWDPKTWDGKTRPPPGWTVSWDGILKKQGAARGEYDLALDNGAKAIIRTYGCNVFTWITKDGIEVMGKRGDAADPRADEKPYAGGAPHCFPQFGPGALMQHGFARGMVFEVEERAKKLSFDRMIFKLVTTEETKKVWDADFEYRFDVTLRADSLEWEVAVINKGDKPFDATLGLHNYFDVSSLKNVKITGPFKGAETVDKTNGATGVAASDEIVVDKAIDTLYKGVKGPITITDTGKGTKTTIERKGYSDSVIWSPYGNDAMGYDKFICVEPVQATPVTFPVGKFKETHYYQKVTCVKL